MHLAITEAENYIWTQRAIWKSHVNSLTLSDGYKQRVAGALDQDNLTVWRDGANIVLVIAPKSGNTVTTITATTTFAAELRSAQRRTKRPYLACK